MSNHQNVGEIGYKLKMPARAVGIFGASLLVAACSSATNSSDHRPPKARHTLELTPDMSNFLLPGSTTTCYNGGARPCALLLRTRPELAGQYVNANPTQGRVDWPLEAYRSEPGDNLKVLCYTPHGQRITAIEGNSASKDWYRVPVPYSKVLNPVVQEQIRTHDPAVDVVRSGGTLTVLAWASVEWFDQPAALSSVPVCD